MNKRLVFGSTVLALVLAFSTLGCTIKDSSYVADGKGTDSYSKAESDETSENNEIQETVKYKSLIEKYVGNIGTSYIAYNLMVRHDEFFYEDHNRVMPLIYPAEKWMNSDGRLTLPFEPNIEDYMDTKGVACYYIPDELAVEVSTGELIEILWSYSYNTGQIMSLRTPMNPTLFEYEFYNNLAYSNALEESLRRDEFAGEYLEKYMTESESMPNAETVPEYYEGMNAEELSLYFTAFRQSYMLDMSEVVLAQPEAYAQLTDEQRAELVKRVIERFNLGEQGKLCISSNEYNSLFFACVTGKCYLSGDSAYIPFDKGEAPWRINPYVKGEIQWQDNPWIDAINEMDFTEDEQRVIDKYFNADK